eukprot:CAMPEP_0203895030 /NCGR_PEP_ID=MMETSP0359-20131031/37916_1 /ASSEMBLY_ACC=CAM_ASM_000338 /TAXON_ID=268821 /ORGANISM="Scrippsiella Hangoei, Strain SHTV-5" /LENGTH=66 /DNA_ID=CAMNT_0050817443 /DNA_START=11 /DNA_END=210 /DNA_ORIENTATION=+
MVNHSQRTTAKFQSSQLDLKVCGPDPAEDLLARGVLDTSPLLQQEAAAAALAAAAAAAAAATGNGQ